MIINKIREFFGMEPITNSATHTVLERDRLSNLLGVSHGGERDLYDIYGYPAYPQYDILHKYATRQGMAHRITRGIPKSCWSDGFDIYADEEHTDKPILADELDTIIRNDFLSVAIRADTLNRIGRFAAIFVGVPDGLDPVEPIGKVQGKALESVYFRPFAYDGIQPHKYDIDPASPRMGMPVLYQLQIIGRGDTEKDVTKQVIIAHWSRVIHLCEEQLDSSIEGIPALLPVFNRILDLDKVLGGSAEAYFRNARGKIGFEIDKEFSSDLISTPGAKEKFDAAARRFTNNQQDQIAVVGAKVVPVSTPHQGPSETVKSLLWEISGQTRIPIRFLTGEGGGQLAGSEDKLAYNSLVSDRQNVFCDPTVRRMLDILVDCGALPALPDKYHIEWRIQESTSETELAAVNAQKANALAAVLNATSMTGEGIELESALAEIGLQDVKVVEVEIPDDDGFGLDDESGDDEEPEEEPEEE